MSPPQTREERELAPAELLDAWALLDDEERVDAFHLLSRAEADDFFLSLATRDQAALLLALPAGERRLWLRLLAPDDTVDLLQSVPEEERESLLADLDEPTRIEVRALLAYAEDVAGGLMSPRYGRLRPDATVEEALRYLRAQARQRLETMHYAYVLDDAQRLSGVLSVRELFGAEGSQRVRDIMTTDVVTVPPDLDQEQVARLMATHDLAAIPVVDENGRMIGIVTVDDIVDVMQEEATEDIQKMGGSATLGAPYLQVRLTSMLKKRAGWLTVLFLSEMLTATAMGYFQAEIARAVILALFVPLVISSGGNSGSQATTLIIRAMALGEVRLRDWWRVVRRELTTGLALGGILGTIGFLRIMTWQALFHTYGIHAVVIGLTVATSLVGVVTWGTLAGSMLPFALRRVGVDPASASAPFVATLVDVTGLIIYFTTARLILTGTLL